MPEKLIAEMQQEWAASQGTLTALNDAPARAIPELNLGVVGTP